VLFLAVFKLIDMCSEHTVRQLNAVLPTGARHVFRLVYAEFHKYYKYSRRADAPPGESTTNDDYIHCLYTG